MNVTTYAPPANATPVITSKPIQMPHGKSCERFVVAARPFVKRIVNRTAATRRMIPAMILNGVRSFPLGFNSLRRNAAKRLDSPATRSSERFPLFISPSAFALVTVFFCRVAKSKEKRRPESQHNRHSIEIILTQLRIRSGVKISSETDLFQRNF